MENKIREENLEASLLASYAKDKWKKIGTQKRSGVLAPLFSVYSEDSAGIGEYNDLKLLVDWCVKTGNSILQLLPMNDVGSVFCPYDSTSSFALEPMYISLGRLPYSRKRKFSAWITELKRIFPAGTPYVDYEVKSEKMRLLWDIYEEIFIHSKEFRDFTEKNDYWLDDFALFHTLKFLENGKAWFDWEERFRTRDPSALQVLRGEHEKNILFHKWVQWQLYKQFAEVKSYAGEKNVLVKGDLPILVSRDSADVWAHPEYFKMDFAAGAPPDMYCAKGQRWGTPTYQWERIFADGGRYVKEKLAYAENFYDILRIDHVVGLFRIWSIPYHDPAENMGLHGAFDPAHEHLWEEHGRKILKFMLDNTGMLLCAEDLGVVPKSCAKVLKELGIPGNEVQRWTKDWAQRHDFLLPEEFRPLSVAMLSTHDTTNLPAWWENEAGTIDEALFMRRAHERGINGELAKSKLFDPQRSCHARLRWLGAIDSVDKVVHILGKRREEVKDFIDWYLDSYQEKEKLWKLLNLAGPMRERSDKEFVTAVLRYVVSSNSVFVINLITDWLYLAEIFPQDAYSYRINTPGTVDDKNWSLVMPMALEALLKNDINKEIKALLSDAKR